MGFLDKLFRKSEPPRPGVPCRLCGATYDLTPYLGRLIRFDGTKIACPRCGGQGVYFEDMQKALQEFQGF